MGRNPAGDTEQHRTPGVVSALLAMLSRYGTMSFSKVAESALVFARQGFPAYQLLCKALSSRERIENIRKYPASERVYLPGGQPPALGSMFKQEDLGRTLSMMIAAEQQALSQGRGREAAIDAAREVFYIGDVARADVGSHPRPRRSLFLQGLR